MHIAYISADRGIHVYGAKGASVHIRSMVNSFADLGHRVTLLGARCGVESSPLDARFVKIRVDETQILIGTDEQRTSAKEELSKEIGEQAYQHLLALHQDDPIDLIYERYSLFSSAGVRAAEKLGVPCLVEVNAPLIEEQQAHRHLVDDGAAMTVRRQVFTNADALLPVSSAVGDYAISHGADPACVTVIANGFSPGLFHPRVEPVALEPLQGSQVIGFSGSLKPWHGIEILMDAFRTLAVGQLNLHLLIVGDGPMRDWVEGYAVGASLQRQVTVSGWLPVEQVPAYLRRMDIAVAPYPASDNFYFSPLKLYEYMAVARPVVASRIGQIASYLHDGADSLLVRPGDTQQLSEALRRLLDHPQLRTRLGEAAAVSVAERTWVNNARRVMAIAQPLMNAA